jgi:hypothetical protein
MNGFGKIALLGIGLGMLGLGSTIFATRTANAIQAREIIPVAFNCPISNFSGSGIGTCQLPTVRAGYHFEIQTVSAQLQINAGHPTQVSLRLQTNGPIVDHFFPAAHQGDSAFFTGDFFTVNQAVQLSADSGSTPEFMVIISDGPPGFAELTAAGRLVLD